MRTSSGRDPLPGAGGLKSPGSAGEARKATANHIAATGGGGGGLGPGGVPAAAWKAGTLRRETCEGQ